MPLFFMENVDSSKLGLPTGPDWFQQGRIRRDEGTWEFRCLLCRHQSKDFILCA